MDKEVVIVVATEAAAYEVVKSLKSLDDEGSIELYASTVVEKSADGQLTVKEARDVRGPSGTALGLTTGALIGLLAGPVGAAVGAAIGGAAGLGGDLAYSGFAGDFVHDVAARLQPGNYAVCASVWEDWTVPIDVAVSPFGGVVFRQATDDIALAQIRAELQALNEEQAHLEAEITRAKNSAKAKLESSRHELYAKQAAERERLRRRLSKLQDTWDAKIASIKEKTAEAKTEAKTRHQRHTEKLAQFATLQRESFRQLFA
jgi:uncharacterized membrane protein